MSSVLPFTPVPSTIAAFDYDGTLTHRDTLLPFLARVSTTRFLLALFTTAPAIAAFLLHLRPREHAKQALCKAVLRGRPRS
ncbi:MAG TPA: hypothetical protein VEA17_22585 [Bordetella sp.]|nr:hypothetical protein [Bordetella sp.]